MITSQRNFRISVCLSSKRFKYSWIEHFWRSFLVILLDLRSWFGQIIRIFDFIMISIKAIINMRFNLYFWKYVPQAIYIVFVDDCNSIYSEIFIPYCYALLAIQSKLVVQRQRGLLFSLIFVQTPAFKNSFHRVFKLSNWCSFINFMFTNCFSFLLVINSFTFIFYL